MKYHVPAKVQEYQGLLKKMMAATEKGVDSLKPLDVMKDKTMRVAFMQYAATRHVSENPNFMLAVGKKDMGVYNEFIKDGSSQQINISNSLHKEFDVAADANNIGAAPWKNAIAEVVGLMATNDMAPFAQYMMTGK